jgi:hypothetical protein
MKRYLWVLFRMGMGIVGLVVIKSSISGLDTTGWSPAVITMVNDILPIVLLHLSSWE